MTGSFIWIILFLGAIIIFIFGYRKYIPILELSGMILLAIFTICYFLFPTVFGAINLQAYFLTIISGLITSIIFLIVRINKKIKRKNCGEKISKRSKFCRKCGTALDSKKI
jgi:hypothetical protein